MSFPGDDSGLPGIYLVVSMMAVITFGDLVLHPTNWLSYIAAGMSMLMGAVAFEAYLRLAHGASLRARAGASHE